MRHQKNTNIFILLAIFLLIVTIFAYSSTPEKPYPALADGDRLEAVWLMGMFNVIYDWAQTTNNGYTLHVASAIEHGVTGAVVGTTNTQSLTSKTLDSTNSIAGEAVNSGTVADARIATTICRDSELTTHGNLTAAHGATGAAMGTTNVQTVTNKTMSTGCTWGGTAVPVANGGTGATVAATARTNLGLGDSATKNVGAAAGTVSAGDHAHSTLTRGTGLTGNNYTGAAATTWAVSYGTAAGTAAQGNDSRLSDARTPTAHTLVSHTASGLTSGHFLKATGATTYAFGAHGLTYTDVGAPPNARSITAGVGMTGGGDLSANRTITLGTPSTLTVSTANSVTTTTHTHAVTFPVTSINGSTGAITINYAVSASAGGNASVANAIRTAAPATPADGDIWTE